MDYQAIHFPWGVPPGGRGDGACVLTQPTYVNIYSNSLRIPLLVGGTVKGFVSAVEPVNTAETVLYCCYY